MRNERPALTYSLLALAGVAAASFLTGWLLARQIRPDHWDAGGGWDEEDDGDHEHLIGRTVLGVRH